MPQWLQQADEAVLAWIAEHLRVSFLDPIVIFYTNLGNKGLVFIGAALLLLLFRKTRRAGGAALGGLVLGGIAVNLTLKPLVARPRPYQVMELLEPLMDAPNDYSFPSGHTNAAFAFAAALCVALPASCKKGKTAALIAAVLMGLSRLYVGVHFPSDVVCGALVGSLCGALAGWLAGKITRAVRSHR